MTYTMASRTKSLSAMVKFYYQSIDREDIAAALAFFSPNAVYRRPGYDALRGYGAISTFYHEERVITGGQHELEAVIEDGNRIAVRGRFKGTLRSGESTSIRFADFWRFAGSLVVERDTYFYVAAV